jgi:hypothetical protein
MENWWADLGSPALTETLKQKVVEGVEEELAGKQDSTLTMERDRLLVDLIEAKSKAKNLP